MKRANAFVAALVLSLASCAQPTPSSAPAANPPLVTGVASGPIADACLGSGRAAVTRERCNCIQTVANNTLSLPDQRRGAGFFGSPEKAQEVRLSDTRANDRFWRDWTYFGREADRICRRV